MTTLIIPYKPHDNQRLIHNDTHRFRVLVCGRRFGKTTLAINELIKHAALNPKSNNWYLAPTYRQAKMTAWRKLFEFLPLEMIAKKNETELSVRLVNGSLIELKGCEVPDNLRGVGLDFVILDEYADIRPSVFQEIIRPALSDKQGRAIFTGTPKGYNHFYEAYIRQDMDKDYKSFRFTTYDNPHIPTVEIDKARQELSEDYFMQEYMGEFRKFTGLIYKDFSRSLHLLEPFDIPRGWTRYRAIDYGYQNPFACLFLATDNDDNIYVYDEHYERGKTIEENCKEILNKTGSQDIRLTIIDPSVEQTSGQTGLSLREYITRSGIITVLANNDVLAGINTVTTYLKPSEINGKPKLYIFKHCENLIKEIESYAWEDKREGQNDKQKPKKVNDHACIYGNAKILMANGRHKLIRNIKKGDMVYTPIGNKRVIACGLTEKSAKVIRVTYRDKSLYMGLTLTADHKVYIAGKGFIPVSTLLNKGTSKKTQLCSDTNIQLACDTRDYIADNLNRTENMKTYPIVDIKPLTIHKDVYNITVEDAGCFFANGVLVSNCDALRYMCMELASTVTKDSDKIVSNATRTDFVRDRTIYDIKF